MNRMTRTMGPAWGQWSARLGFVFCLGLALPLAGGCGGQPTVTSKPPPIDAPLPYERGQPPPVRYKDVTSQAGITFVHVNGGYGKKLLPETMGSGVALIDFDRDGHQDLIFVNSCYWPGHEEKGKPVPTLAC